MSGRGYLTQCQVPGCGETTRLPAPGIWWCPRHTSRATAPPPRPWWWRIMPAILLVALPAQAADKGPPCEIISMTVRRGTLVSAKSGAELPVVGGEYQDPASAECLGKERERTKAKLEFYEQTPLITQSTLAVTGGVAVVLGVVIGFLARGAAR